MGRRYVAKGRSYKGHVYYPAVWNHKGELDPRISPTGIQERLSRNDPWWEWVEDYSSRKLTYLRDKYAAFAGIAVHYQNWKTAEIVAGLRMNHLTEDLLWVPRKQITKPKLEGVPSWSWFSVDGPVRRFSFQRRPEAEEVIQSTKIKILNCNVDWSVQPLTSWTLGGGHQGQRKDFRCSRTKVIPELVNI